MKVIKPLTMSLTHRTYTYREQHWFSIKPILFFALDNPASIVPEADAWQRILPELPTGTPLDEGYPKGSSEILLVGNARSLGGEVEKLSVTVNFSNVSKTLHVSGYRHWQKAGWLGGFKPSRTTRFTKMPLDWAHAFGGADNKKNPLGVGSMQKGNYGEVEVMLPSVTYPGADLKTPKHEIEPAGFGPLHPSWKPRIDFASVYDRAHMETEFPALPTDLDFHIFNMAPSDQFVGDMESGQAISLQNCSPAREVFRSQLPGMAARAFVVRGDTFEEVRQSPETLWLFPEKNIGALIFKGVVQTDKPAAQISYDALLLAYERSSDECRPISHYQNVYRLRTDEKEAIKHLLDDSQLTPRLSASEQTSRSAEHEREVDRRNALQQQAWEATKSKHREKTGRDLDEQHAPPPVDPALVIAPEAQKRRDFSLVPLFQSVSALQRSSDELQKKQQANAPADTTDTYPLSDDQVVGQALHNASKRRVKLPERSEKTLDGIPDQATISEVAAYERKLGGLSVALSPRKDSYIYKDAAGESLRRFVESLLESGGETFNRDLTGADLSDFSFEQRDWRGSIFECADLSGVEFKGCCLTNCSFVGAKLDGARFIECDLSGANFSSSFGQNVFLDQGRMSSPATISNAKLINSNFDGIVLSRLQLIDSDLSGSIFSNVQVERLNIIRSRLDTCNIRNTALSTVNFTDCSLSHLQIADCTLERTLFLNSDLQAAEYTNCRLSRCQIAGDTLFTLGSIQSSTLDLCGMRGTTATGIELTDVVMKRVDLGLCSLRAAKLHNVLLEECLLGYSDFSQSCLTDSTLYRCSLEWSDLSRCELAQVNFAESDVLTINFEDTDLSETSDLLPTKLKRVVG